MHMISAADVAFIGEALRTVYVGLWIVAATLVLSLIHISEPTRRHHVSRMPSSA